jgi:4-amino-4-deoxy-L-arabinose transferase-like glycosyltransferase
MNDSPQHMTHAPRRSRTIAGLLLVVAALHLALAVGSALTKRPWSDEAWFASPALNLATKGFMGTTVLETEGLWLRGIERRTYWVMPLYLVGQAGWYRLVGFSLLKMRLLSAVWGLVALAAWWQIVRALFGSRRLAVLAAALLACDYIFVMAASFGRMDMMSAALGSAAFAAYLTLRERRLGWAVFAGHALTALSGLTHPHGGVLTFAGLLFLTLYFDRARLRPAHLAVAFAPYFVGALCWGGYVLQDPPTFWAQFKGNATTSGRASTLAAPLTGFRREVTERYLVAYGLGPHSAGHSGPIRLKALVLAAYLCALAGALAVPSLRRERGVRALLVLAAVYFVALAVGDGQKLSYYLIYPVPIYTALVAVWLRWCWGRGRAGRAFAAACVAGLVALQAGGVLYRMRVNTYGRQFAPAVAYLREHTDARTLVMGSAELGFGLGFDRNLVDDIRLGYYSGKRPDVIVIEEIYEQNIRDYQAREPDVYRHITQLLEQYRPVYDESGYRVYVRR